MSEFVQDMSRSSDALDNATLDMGGGSGAGFQIYCAANIGNGSGGDSDSGDDKLVAETMLATAGGGGGGGGFQGRPREFLTFGGGGGGGLQFRSFRNTRNLTSRLTEWASLGGGGGCGTIGNADDDDARLECDTEDTFGASPPVACGQHFDDGSGSRDWDAAASFLLFEESLQQCARGRDSAVVVRGGGGGGGGAGTACEPFSIGYGFGFEARISNGSGHISDPDNVDGHHAPTISGDEESKDVVGAIYKTRHQHAQHRLHEMVLLLITKVAPPVHRADGLVFVPLHRSKFTSACSPSRLVKAALEVSNALRLSCTSNAGSVPRTPRLLPCHLVLGAPRESIAMEAFWLSSPASRAAEITEATIKSERKQTRNLTAGAVATTPCLFKIIQMTMR